MSEIFFLGSPTSKKLVHNKSSAQTTMPIHFKIGHTFYFGLIDAQVFGIAQKITPISFNSLKRVLFLNKSIDLSNSLCICSLFGALLMKETVLAKNSLSIFL